MITKKQREESVKMAKHYAKEFGSNANVIRLLGIGQRTFYDWLEGKSLMPETARRFCKLCLMMPDSPIGKMAKKLMEKG